MKKLIIFVSLLICVCMIFISFSSAVEVQVSHTLKPRQSCNFNNSISREKPPTHVVVPGDGEKIYYAIIAGCSRYQDRSHNLPPFGKPFPESTFKYVYDVLVNTSNWEKDHIVLLLNEDATKQNILDSLIDISSLVDGDDVFLFSWNGHGTQIEDLDGDDGDGKDEAICPYDTQKEGGEILNVITDDELDSYFSMIPAEGLFLMFECCMSGGLVDTNTHHKYSFVDVDEERRVVVMSTPPDKKGLAMHKIGWPMLLLYGIAFSNASCDTDKNGWISAEEAFTYVQTAYPVFEYEFWLTMMNKFAIPLSTVFVFIYSNIFLKMMGLKLGARLVLSTLYAGFAFVFYHLMKKQLIVFSLLYFKMMGAENDPNMSDGYVGDLNIVQI
ncbi:MAG: caspase family protein [Candidatus Thermoplasmatota archaeon]|nr:caspase family protein [Candidatus Thermoplasmatota archaeon]